MPEHLRDFCEGRSSIWLYACMSFGMSVAFFAAFVVSRVIEGR